MTRLFDIPWYRDLIDNKQMVMIGYSDSAKDAGVMAASWAQYRAQDALIKLCEKSGVTLTLFHGRGVLSAVEVRRHMLHYYHNHRVV